jgi:hypothetical protein
MEGNINKTHNKMKATIEKDELVIRIPLETKPAPSKSGKTLIVASTGGFLATTAQVDGKPVKVSLNAIISR